MSETVELSVALPRSVDTRIYIRVTTQAKAIMVSLTTASGEELGTATPIGSLVYALPDRFDASQPLSTPLYTVEATVEFASRLAKLLAKKTQLPTYVSSSVSLASTGLGGTMDEEMDAYRAVVDAVMPRVQHLVRGATALPNGVGSS